MADKTTIQMGENSPEHVAFKLFNIIADLEKRSITGYAGDGYKPADRLYVLQTMVDCLNAVKHGSLPTK